MRTSTLAAGIAALAMLAGCGDDDSGDGAETAGRATTATTAPAPAGSEAVAEIATVRQLLDRAVDEYRDGDAKSAERTVGDAYLEHFEEVEEPLEERDPELMESLEETIATTIRDRIRAGASPAEVQSLVVGAKRGLDRAEAALR
ncbi:MAG TPA: hypothetical protein VF520_12250 [Thermoleophilaceae bacterium]